MQVIDITRGPVSYKNHYVNLLRSVGNVLRRGWVGTERVDRVGQVGVEGGYGGKYQYSPCSYSPVTKGFSFMTTKSHGDNEFLNCAEIPGAPIALAGARKPRGNGQNSDEAGRYQEIPPF